MCQIPRQMPYRAVSDAEADVMLDGGLPHVPDRVLPGLQDAPYLSMHVPPHMHVPLGCHHAGQDRDIHHAGQDSPLDIHHTGQRNHDGLYGSHNWTGPLAGPCATGHDSIPRHALPHALLDAFRMGTGHTQATPGMGTVTGSHPGMGMGMGYAWGGMGHAQ